MTKKIQIEGMRCNHCTSSVQETLENMAGVVAVEVRLEEKCAIISGDVSDDRIKEAIDDIGFDVIVITEV